MKEINEIATLCPQLHSNGLAIELTSSAFLSAASAGVNDEPVG